MSVVALDTAVTVDGCIRLLSKLEWDAATTQLAHGHNYKACKWPCASCMLLLHHTSNLVPMDADALSH